MAEFWETDGFYTTNSLDEYLSHSKNTSVRQVVLGNQLLPDVVPSGIRVTFDGKLSSLLAYPDPPERGVIGTVVMVRTAMGDTTTHEGVVFVKWDNGRLTGTRREHLTPAPTSTRRSSSYRRVVSSLGDLDDFLRCGSEDELVHKATKDLWSLRKVDGDFVIERLFNDTGSPLKV